MFTVYDKTGENIRCTTGKLEYNGTFMGECSVTIDIISPTPIDFHIGDYLIYRGETFEINYDPSVIKTARVNTVGDAFKYEKIKFNSYSDELARVDFLDFVPNDNNAHFTALPTFSFFCADVTDLARRIQANLDRVYTGSKKWTVSVHQEFVGKKDVNISVSDIKVWDALGLANSDFEANFIIRGRTITIGTAGIAVGNMFAYGKNNGLFEIERNAESDQAIITRLRAYGSEKNLPPRYYNKLSQSLPNNMAVTHLMLPGFPLSTQDPHIDSSNISELGVREGTVFFDGSNGNEEIYPSIEGMTYGGHNIDEVQSAEQTTDDGTWEVPEGETSVNIPNFTITLYNLGFDIRDYLIEGQNPVIAMKSGLCAGREFEIVNVSQDEQTGYYTLECRRTEDSSLGLVFPYKDYNVQAGDKFVLLYISMPTEYITAASQRLYDAAVAYLAKCDYVRYSYSPKVDNIFLQRQHDSAIANSGTSIHDTIKEGDLLLFSDTDLGISGSIIIDQLTIKEGDELIPQYEITLRNDKTVGTIQRLQQQIDSIINGSTSVGGYNAQQIQSIIRAYGDTRYLRKDIDDVARGTVDFLKGIQVGTNFISGLLGEGGIFRKDADGTTYIETDRLYVRLKAYFDEIEVKKYEHSGGNRIASKVGNKTVKVVKYDSNGDPIADDDITTPVSFYRCYIKLSETDADGNTTTTSNDWKVGDLARSQEFNIGNNGSEVTVHGYWREVVGVGATADADGLGYIDLSNMNTKCMSGSNPPKPQDDIIQLGSTNDDTRRGAIIEYSTGSNAPAYQIYQGIGSDPTNRYTLEGKNYITIGYNGSNHKAEIIGYGDAYFGDRPSYDGQGHDLRRSYLEYDSTTGQMTIKADLKITAPVTNTETDLVDWIYGDFKNIEQLTQLLNSVELDFGAIEWREGELANNADLNAMIQGGDTTASSLKTTMTSNFSLLQSAYQSLATAINNVKNAGTVSDQTLSTIQGLYNTYKARKLTTETSVSSVSDYLLHYNYQGISDLDYLKQALQEDTQVTGGLIQSSLLSLGYHEASTNVYKTMAGLNGIYDSTKIGNGIAAWYGGAMTDIEGKVTRVTSPSGNPSAKNYYEYDSTNNIYIPSKDTTVTSGKTYYKRDWDSLSDSQKKTTTDYAKSLFRMDGTGYVASGNISWDSLGRVTLKNLYTDTGKSIDQLLALFSIGGTIPTNAYIAPAYPFNSLSVLVDGSSVDVIEALQKLQQLFVAHYKEVNGVQTNKLESIEATAPLWSQGEVSALGYNGSGGGGGGGADLSAVWATLTGNTGTYKDYQINIGHLTSALSNYALSSSLATVATSGSYNDLTNKPTIPAAQIQSNWTQTNTSAKDYIKNKPTIPAAQIQSDWNQTSTSAKDYIKNKPTNVSAFNNDANYVTSSSLTTTLASYATQTWVTNKGYATTSAMNTALSGYLPLTGGTLSGNLSVTRSGTSASKVAVAHDSVTASLFLASNNQRGVYDDTNSRWIVGTNGTNTFMMGGNVGINTTAPSYQLHVNGNTYASRYYVGGENYLGGGSTQLYFGIGGTNPIVAGSTYVRRGTSEDDAAITLGTSNYRWANVYSVLGNFSGLITASGNIKTASYIEIGDYRIVADTANTALKVVNKDGTTAVNFYATGENSALGVNTSGGGGGGGMDIEAMWAQLGNSDASRKINYVHIQDALTNNGYATQSWVTSQGYLTSYTETDPVFTASAAHGITSSDITSWNNKVSNVQADWNATSGLAVILNKPTNLVTTTSLATTLQGYVTALGTNDPYITWTRNGVANNILPPSAYSLYVQSETTTANITSNKITYTKVSKLNAGSLPVSDNTNVLLNVARTNGSTYGSQLAFSSTQYLYFRAFGNASADTTQRWKRVAFNEDWEVPYTIGSWSKIIRIKNYGTIQLSVRLAQSGQSATYMFLVTTSNNASRCYQIASGNYASNSEFAIRVTRQSTNSFDVEIKSDYAYSSTTTSTCYASWIVNGIMTDSTYPSVSIYTEVTAGGGTVSSGNFTTVRNADLVNATIYSPNLHLTAADGTSPMTVTSTTMVANLQAEYASKLKTSRTLWGQSFDGSENVSGNMTGVGSLDASGDITVTRSSTTSAIMKVVNENGAVSLLASVNRGVYDSETSKWVIGTNGTNTFLMDGNVGINTTSPQHQLHIQDNTYAYSSIGLSGTTISFRKLSTQTTGFNHALRFIRHDSSNEIVESVGLIGVYSTDTYKHTYFCGTYNNSAMRIDGVGTDANVGIGLTTAPSYKLHVNGAAYVTNLYLNGENRFGGNSTQLFAYIGTANPFVLGSNYVRRGTSDTDVTLGTSSYRWANLYSVLGNFSGQITSSVATGTSPLSVASTTLNTNLNADLLDGYHATELARLGWKIFSQWNSTGSSDQCRWREIDAPSTSSHRVVYDIVSFRYGYPYISYYRLTLFSYSTTHLSVSLVNLGTAHRNAGFSRICVGISTDGKVYIQSGSTGGNNYLYVRNILSTDEVSAGTIHTDSVGEAEFGTANGFTAAKIITDTGYCRVNRSTGAVDTSGDPSITTSLRIGDACIWWDETNKCLRITGANANGLRSTSVAVNVNVSGEVTALKTS